MRSPGSDFLVSAGVRARNLDELAVALLLLGLLARLFAAGLLALGLFGLDDVDAHLVEHREDVLELLGIDLFHQRVDLLVGDIAALLRGADQRLHGGVRPVDRRAVRRAFGTLLLQHLFLLRRYLGLACHDSPPPTLRPRRTLGLRLRRSEEEPRTSGRAESAPTAPSRSGHRSVRSAKATIPR